jgi:hypothetical protein
LGILHSDCSATLETESYIFICCSEVHGKFRKRIVESACYCSIQKLLTFCVLSSTLCTGRYMNLKRRKCVQGVGYYISRHRKTY